MIWIVIWLKQLNNIRSPIDLKKQNIRYINKHWAQLSVFSLIIFYRELKREINFDLKSIGFYDTFYDVYCR